MQKELSAADKIKMYSRAKEVSRTLKSVSHPVRLKILCRLSEGPCSVQELEEVCGLSQAGTSQFLARLRAEKAVKAERQGQNVIYSLLDPKLAELVCAISRIYCREETRVK